ncbi:MAG TPA: hypothetical protein VJ548_10230 [Azospira sp.]|nr:hypothetical protein [Azospira sp.]
MSGFENFQQDANELEHEIVRRGIVLGIDWNDEAQVRLLAREALDHAKEVSRAAAACCNHEGQAKAELFAFAALMLRTMQESAEDEGVLTHGGPAWKAFARALWQESGLATADSGRSAPK